MTSIADYFVWMEPIWEEDDYFEVWAAPLWDKRPRRSDAAEEDNPVVLGGGDQPEGEFNKVPQVGPSIMENQPKVGDQYKEQTSLSMEEEDGWLGSKDDQEYFLSTTSPYINLR